MRCSGPRPAEPSPGRTKHSLWRPHESRDVRLPCGTGPAGAPAAASDPRACARCAGRNPRAIPDRRKTPLRAATTTIRRSARRRTALRRVSKSEPLRPGAPENDGAARRTAPFGQAIRGRLPLGPHAPDGRPAPALPRDSDSRALVGLAGRLRGPWLRLG